MAEKMNLSGASEKQDFQSYIEDRAKRSLAERTLKQVKLPGWYYDCRGILCISVDKYLISLFVDTEGDVTVPYNVAVDCADSKGCLSENVFWESYSEWEDAVNKGLELYRELSNGNIKVLLS